MGVIRKIADALGYVPVDEAAVRDGLLADAATRGDMAKLVPLPVAQAPKISTRLALTDRQELAMLNPWMPMTAPPAGFLFDSVMLADGTAVTTMLLVACAREGHLIWCATGSLGGPLGKGQRGLLRPKGMQKGLVQNRVDALLKGVGDIDSAEGGRWQNKGTHFTRERRLSMSEEAEFMRLHGVKWKTDAHTAMLRAEQAEQAAKPGDDSGKPKGA